MQTVLSNENIAAACDRAEEFLTGRKADRREVLRVRLGLEEALLAYQQHFGAEAPFTLDLGGFLSGSRIKLTVPGTMLDPFLRTAEDSDSDRFMRSALTQLGQLPVWRYSRRTNVVSFALSRQRHPDWVMLLGAVITALVLGFLLRMAPSSVSSLIQEGIVAPLLDTFLGFLNAVAGPMIFLSVVWGIYSMGDVATFSVLGKRLGAWYGVLLVAITLLTVLATTPLFSLRFGVSQGGGSFADLYRMVLDIVPSNLFPPSPGEIRCRSCSWPSSSGSP